MQRSETRRIVLTLSAVVALFAISARELDATGQSEQTSVTGTRGGVAVAGGVSPDGRYEIRVVEAAREPSNYAIALIESASGRLVKEFAEGGGVFSYPNAGKYAKALWHGSSRFVAVTDFGSRHSNRLYLYEVGSADVMRIGLPDYSQNALGRIGATVLLEPHTTELLRWDGDVLLARFSFHGEDRSRPGGSSPPFVVTFSLRLRYGAPNASSVTFESMGKPVRASSPRP